jgi:hypothetical protein
MRGFARDQHAKTLKRFLVAPKGEKKKKKEKTQININNKINIMHGGESESPPPVSENEVLGHFPKQRGTLCDGV